MNWKDYIKFFLFKIGRRSTLPAAYVNRKKIFENQEKMVNLKTDSSFFFGGNLLKSDVVLLRIGVYQRLKVAQQQLPPGISFKIYSAYRSLQEQYKLWENECALYRQQFPELSQLEIENKVRAVCADPRRGFGGHQTGGAVDISLCNQEGQDLDMGNGYLEMSSLTPTFSNKIFGEPKGNRLLLYQILTAQGFQNYPNEWWHYCYGDRMWAAYQGQPQAIYGLIE